MRILHTIFQICYKLFPHQFRFPSTMPKGSFLFILSPTQIYICMYFKQPFQQVWGEVLTYISLWLVILSIFSWACCPLCFRWKNVYSDPLLISKLDVCAALHVCVCYWVVGIPCILNIITSYLIHTLQIFSLILLIFSFIV